MSNNTLKPRPGLWADGLGWVGTRAAQVLLVLALVFVAAFTLSQVTLVVIPVLMALILTAAISPAVNWMTRKGMNHAIATVVSFISLILIFGGIITGIAFAIKNEWSTLVTSATKGFDKLYTWVRDVSPIEINDNLIQEGQDKVVGFLGSSNFSSGAISSLGAVGSFGTGFVLMAVILFYFLKDGAKIWEFFLSWLGGERKKKAELAGERSMQLLGGYVRGTAAVAGVDAVFIGGALFFLGVPLALPLAVLTFIGGFIPLVGATAAGAFAVLIALVSNDPLTALIVLIVVIAVNQLEGNLLQPVLMGNALKVHALVILIALTIGTIQAGIVGAVLSVPLVAVGWAIIKVWTGRDSDSPANHENDAEPTGDTPSVASPALPATSVLAVTAPETASTPAAAAPQPVSAPPATQTGSSEAKPVQQAQKPKNPASRKPLRRRGQR